jgi:hypothetical protein
VYLRMLTAFVASSLLSSTDVIDVAFLVSTQRFADASHEVVRKKKKKASTTQTAFLLHPP